MTYQNNYFIVAPIYTSNTSKGASMNKQYAFALLFISLLISKNIQTQEGPRGQGSSNPDKREQRHEAEHETFAAIQESKTITPYSDEFCEKAIAKAPIPLKKEIARLLDPRRRAEMLPAIVILHGQTGSGKSTLAKIIMQRMNMPYIIVSGKKLANEFVNSGSAGIKRVENLAITKNANIYIDEIESVTKNKEKQSINERNDDTPGAFWTMLDALEEKNLLFIGTTNNITGIPDPLQNRFEACLYHMPYIFDLIQIGSLIDEFSNRCAFESEKTKERIQKKLAGQPIRTIKKAMRGAIKLAKDRNLEVPIITYHDFKSALEKIEDDRKSLKQPTYDREKIVNYTFQTISAATAVGGLYLAYQNHQLAVANHALAVESLAHNKSISAKNVLHQEQTSDMQAASLIIGATSLGLATAMACTIV